MLIATATPDDLEAAWWKAVSEMDTITLACLMEQRFIDPGVVNHMSRNAIGEVLVSAFIDNDRAQGLVEILLEGGCPVDCDWPKAFSSLTLAAPHRPLSMIKLLRVAGAQIHDDAHGAYLMHDACRNPDHAVALYLMEQGARIDLIRQHDRCPLLIAAVKSGNRALVAALLDRGVALDGQDHDGNTAAMHATKRGELDLVVRLAALGANLDRRNFDHESIRELIDRTPGALVEFEAGLLHATTPEASDDCQPPRRL